VRIARVKGTLEKGFPNGPTRSTRSCALTWTPLWPIASRTTTARQRVN